MKKLLVLRHAKSSWANVQESDLERGLNARGVKDLMKMAKRLRNYDCQPEICLSSPALRTKLTALAVLDIFENPIKIIEPNELYLANIQSLKKEISHSFKQYNFIMLVGHNPGLTNMFNQCCKNRLDNLPTLGCYLLQFENWPSWKAKLLFIDYPKKFR
ncbi:MAG: histidine phosphatase family protein [Bacteroidota bacterium]|nr:histidine phosphatase family protein [Bacteroidota bacterium]